MALLSDEQPCSQSFRPPCAANAHLARVTRLERLQREGIRRIGKAPHFRYVDAKGAPVVGEPLERIRGLGLPPAWQEVAISPSRSAPLQAIGKDAAGRWQYRYHPKHTERQSAAKFRRLIRFAHALPKLRKRLDSDLDQKGLGRDRVLAGVLRILASCFMRPGSEVYANEHGSFGVTTLRPRHVKVKGDRVFFDFRGKSGQMQHRELEDRRIARLIRELLAVPGRDVFKFILDDGAVVDVRRRHVNQYIKEVMGESFSAKDFRTWAGTLLAACALARRAKEPAGLIPRDRKRQVVAAVKETAAQLGNTPAVCRSSYISPVILAEFQSGRVLGCAPESLEELTHPGSRVSRRAEKALLELLEEAAS